MLFELASRPPVPGWSVFTGPGGDGFFRPIGYVSLWVTESFARDDVGLWHAAAFALHAVNAILVFRLGTRMMTARRAWAAAILFAIHGSRPEAVVWIAGRFDLMSALFVLLGLVAFAERRHSAWACLCVVLAAMSKETGFALPFLALLQARAAGDVWRKSLWRAVPLFVSAALMFALRWWIIGGLGGYPGALSLVSSLKAPFARLWVVLLFPLNWSRPVSLVVTLAFAGFLAAVLIFRWKRLSPWFAAMTLAAAAPAVQQLLIGDDLQESRLLYLPALGFCWLIASSARAPVMAAVLVFQFAALQHNIAIWKSVGERSAQTCIQNGRLYHAGKQLRAEPASVDGVYYFAHGLRECAVRQRVRQRH